MITTSSIAAFDFRRAVQEAGLERHVHYLSHGDTYKFRIHNAAAQEGKLS